MELMNQYIDGLPPPADERIKTKIFALFNMVMDGNKDWAIFLLGMMPPMPDELRSFVWECTRRPAEPGRKVEAKADQIWLTIELAKYSGKSVEYGIQKCAEIFDMDNESVKKAWDRSNKRLPDKDLARSIFPNIFPHPPQTRSRKK
jgi:hypothetical protein